MSKAETVRTGKLGKADLRLVRKNGRLFGLADGKVCVEGENADEVWQRLHDEAGKANPKYFGFDGARARFLASSRTASTRRATRTPNATIRSPPNSASTKQRPSSR